MLKLLPAPVTYIRLEAAEVLVMNVTNQTTTRVLGQVSWATNDAWVIGWVYQMDGEEFERKTNLHRYIERLVKSWWKVD